MARDASGQAGTASSTVTLDTMPPRVTIQTPSNGAVMTSTPVTVTGLINDVVVGTVNVEEARVECNGVQAQIANRAFVATPVPLVPGANPIICTGIDRAGNVDTEQINVTVNTAASATITVVSGNNQTARIGTRLPEPLVVALTENGAPATGKPVQFRVLRNDGSLGTTSGSGRVLTVTTDATGQAAVQFTLGTWAGAGNTQVEVTATGFVGETVLSATATPGPPGLIVVDAGNSQEGVIGQPLPSPFVATVVDSGSNRLSGVPVTFTVKAGGGDFDGQPTVTVPTDSDGRAVAVLALGPEEGIENNAVKATFAGNTGSRATFVASGKLAGDPAQTRISGVVLDNSNTPIQGVTLHVEGTSLTTQSDAQGQFVLQPAPVGHVLVVVDGSTVPPRNGLPWPKLEYELVTIAGRDNTVGMPMYLLPIDTPRGILVDETHGGTLTLEEVPGFALTVVPGSATFPEGGRRGTVSVTVVHADKVPMVPNFGQQPRFIITIQPAGTHFNPPAAMTLPNVDGLAPGQKTELYSFDHDLGMFVSIGPATVSEDGTVVQSDPGVGVIKGGWHGGGGPAPPGEAEPVTVTIVPPEEVGFGTQLLPELGSERQVRAATAEPSGEPVVAVGETIEIAAEGSPLSEVGQPFTWSSSDPEIASVDGAPRNTKGEESIKSGVSIKGHKPGETTVRVKYTGDSDKEDTAEVKVRVPHRFSINVTAFIPFPYGLPGIPVPTVPPALLVGGGDHRDFNAKATSFRTRQLVTVQAGSKDVIIEELLNIAAPSTAHVVRDGTIIPEPFLTCTNDNSNMHVTAAKLSSETLQVVLTGSARTCFLLGVGPLLTIDWCYVILITDPEDGPPTYRITGGNDNYPAYEVYINDERIHGDLPSANNVFQLLGSCEEHPVDESGTLRD